MDIINTTQNRVVVPNHYKRQNWILGQRRPGICQSLDLLQRQTYFCRLEGKASVVSLPWNNCWHFFFQHCTDETFTILAELRKCGITDTETCLKTVTLSLNKGQTVRVWKKRGKRLKTTGSEEAGPQSVRELRFSQRASMNAKDMLFLIKWKEIGRAMKSRSAINLALWRFIKKNIVLIKQKKSYFLCQPD